MCIVWTYQTQGWSRSSARAVRILTQRKKDKNNLYVLHAPEIECISKDKARMSYEFNVKMSIATTLKEGLVVAMRMSGTLYVGHTLAEMLEQVGILTEHKPVIVIVDKGYQGVETKGYGSCAWDKSGASH